MPSDDLDQTSSQADRLSRKIERLLSGQPSPVHDGDTEELAELAQQLMQRLDKGIPDPDFRRNLKRDLIAPGPRPVQLPPRVGPRRYPVSAFVGALTVVLVASAVTGWIAFTGPDAAGDRSVQRLAQFASASPTAASATGALVAASAGGTPEALPVSTRTLSSAPEVGQTEALAGGVGAATTIDDVESAAQLPPTQFTAIVELPPVDASHVELGALATVASPSASPPTGVRFGESVDPATVQLDATSDTYRFSTPFVDASLILRGVQEFLGIEAQVEELSRSGKTVYALSSPDGLVNFTWSPESGAFSCTLPEPYSAGDIEDLSNAALEWLEEFGFPMADSGAQPVLQTTDDGQTFIHVPLGGRHLPNPAVGHPMTITLVVDDRNRIVSLSGYWLEVTDQHPVQLVSAQQAWDTVRSGGGYWPDGVAPDRPGQFIAEQFDVSYMLTTSGQADDGLALQPVIAVTGTFTPDDGTDSYPATVYVQAAPQI